MTEIKFGTLSESLIELFPELRLEYEKELEWWHPDKPGDHIIYGDILTPYLINLLKNEGSEEKLGDIFSFLETLATCDDIRVQEVVSVSVLQYLWGAQDLLDKARKIMPPGLKNISKEIEEFGGKKR